MRKDTFWALLEERREKYLVFFPQWSLLNPEEEEKILRNAGFWVMKKMNISPRIVKFIYWMTFHHLSIKISTSPSLSEEKISSNIFITFVSDTQKVIINNTWMIIQSYQTVVITWITLAKVFVNKLHPFDKFWLSSSKRPF